MSKRTQGIESVDLGSGDDFSAAVHGTVSDDGVLTIEQVTVVEPNPLQRLIDSGIVTATDSVPTAGIQPPGIAPMHNLILSNIISVENGVILWREGHLEHVARLYVSDPVQAWRDYADDLTVALAADGSTWAAVVERVRGESE